MNPRAAFWLDRGRWAADFDGWVFLARACHRIGTAHFGAQWGSADPCFEKPQNKPDRPFYDLALAAWERRRWVEQEIVRACSSAQLSAALLGAHAEAIVPLPVLAWALSSERWFWCCQMNLSDPGSLAVAGQGFRFIYVAADGLGELCRQIGETSDRPAAEVSIATPSPKSAAAWVRESSRLAEVDEWIRLQGKLHTIETKTDALCALWSENPSWPPRERAYFRQLVLKKVMGTKNTDD